MNDGELRIYEKYDHLGYDVIRYGVPDLILLKNGKIEFVEVKTKAHYGLNEYQKRAFKLLEKHGLKVRVEMVKGTRRISYRSIFNFPLTPVHSKVSRPCVPPWLFEQT